MPLLTVLVEDSKTIREQLIPTLEELAGARVIAVAETSKGAAEALAEHQDVWRLAVVDIFLREGSGLEVIGACADRRPDQRVVALTNYATADMRTRCLALGADAIFDKSTELDAFLEYCSALGEAQEPRVESWNINETLAPLRHVLDGKGIDGALAFLNARVPHRFTAIFRLEGQTLRLIHFHDKAGGPPLEAARSVPLNMSLCQFALRDGSFVTQDAPSDEEARRCPMSAVMQSYVGLPLQGPAGQLIGTFCHFDTASLALPEREFEFLQDAVKLLPGYIAA